MAFPKILYPINNEKIFDTRTVFCPQMVQYSTVEQLLVENEQLREELFNQQNNVINSIYTMLRIDSYDSKVKVRKNIKDICTRTKGLISEKDIWNLISNEIISKSDLNLIEPNETLLDLFWRLDLLPVLSVYVMYFEFIVRALERHSNKTLISFLNNFKNQSVTKKVKII